MTLSKQTVCLHLCFFFFLLTLPAQVEAGTEQYIRRHLKLMETQEEYRLGGEPVFSRSLLGRLYRKAQPLWSRPRNIDQLLSAIEASSAEGLNPEDYHLQALKRLRPLTAEQGDSWLRADFDLLLTDAFIRLAHDKCSGKVDPKQLHRGWNLPAKAIDDDLVIKLEKGVSTNTVWKTLAALSPQFQTYRNLKQALDRYNEIRKWGGWLSIEAGPLLKVGTNGKRVLTLRHRLAATSDLSWEAVDSSVFDADLEQAVLHFQRRHDLDDDGIVGRKTLAALNRSVDEKIDQVRVNLERARWILRAIPDTCILVDIAGFGLDFHQDGEVIWSTRVVVGKPYHKTPTFASDIKYLVVNPTWTIPRSIIANETLPSILEDPDYLEKNNLRVLNAEGRFIPPASIDWHSYTGKTFPYLIRQDSGPQNALGRIKFLFPNKYSVYLHDTPNRELFQKDRRAFSHGCIRVENPLKLAELILQNDGGEWDMNRLRQRLAGKREKWVKLANPLPIMILYWTVNASSDQWVLFKQDVYGRDKLLLQALDG